MSVFVVSRGWQHEESQPELHRIFAIRNHAVAFIMNEIQEYAAEVRRHDHWKIRPGLDSGPRRWNLEILLDGLDWREDQVWLLEDHEVL